ncbi:ABC transporter permease [Salipiger sp. P9]|uniref:ABC transporter permease n=1 Tax=Salipiger pentaromativorans TaxID=2943193 RepID=UPI0021580F83|nr:ABC transporter permease [Salipiger pentaromativorans]MCR8548392.1 ABC transporter permease [Salipiger pentaromativorans]
MTRSGLVPRLLRGLPALYAVLLLVFLVAPSFLVVPMSFSGNDFLEFPPSSWSLRWYREFWSSPTWRSAAVTSGLVGLLTVALSLPLGTLAASAMRRMTARWRALAGGVLMLPAVVPSILVAIGLFFVLSSVKMVGSLTGLVLGHTALALPIVFVVMSAGFAEFDDQLERAAESLGATRWRIWIDVILPNLRGSLVAAGLLAFVTSLDEVVVAMFVSGGQNATLPKVMFAALRDKIDPTVAAISSQLLLFAVIAMLAMLLSRRKKS